MTTPDDWNPSPLDRLRLLAEVTADSAARLWSQLLGLPAGEADAKVLHLAGTAANAARLLFEELRRRVSAVQPREAEETLIKRPCPRCGKDAVAVLTVDDDYGHEDDCFTCQNAECGHTWWVDGPDA